MIKKTQLLILLLLIFTGCSQQQSPKPHKLKDISYQIDQDGNIMLNKEYAEKNATRSTEMVSRSVSKKTHSNKKYEVIPNFDKQYNKNISIHSKKNKEHKVTVNGKNVKVSVESIPINEFIDLMFFNVLKLNYTVDESIKNMKDPITLNIMNTQSKQNVYDVTSSILNLHGIKIKKKSGVLFLYKSNTKKSLEDNGIYIGYGRSIKSSLPDNENILMFISYNYISSRNANKILQQAGIDIQPHAYSNRGLQLFKAKAGEIRKALKIINLIDRPYLIGKKAYIVGLNDIDASVFIDRMKSIFNANGIDVTKVPSDKAILMTAIPELNSILTISPKQSWTKMLLYWKDKLDIPSKIATKPKFYTYKVKNRKADELATALNSVIELKLASLKTKKNDYFQAIRDKRAGKKIKTITSKSSSVSVKHAIKFDLPTNILMMQLLPTEYRALLPLIEELDALPLQVLAEVTLAEVTLIDDFSLGFEYTLRNDAAAQGIKLTEAAVSTTIGGAGFAASYLSKNLDATINAYAENKLLSIVSKPKILILNNETGNINVGTQIPIVTSETSASDVASINRNISYRNTGVIVGLTPTINSNGILTMNVDLQLSEAQVNSTSGIDSPIIVNRSLKTSLTLKNGETVLLGGLISKNKSTTDSGVPILMDIPWIGDFFKSQSKKTTKTELIILIKPYIIKNTDSMSQETQRYRAILKLLDKYSLF